MHTPAATEYQPPVNNLLKKQPGAGALGYALSVRIATHLDEMESWGEGYQHFLTALGPYGIFYMPGWLHGLWPAYSLQPSTLFFISIWQNEEMLALAPFQVLQKGPLQGWRRIVSLLGTHHPTLANPLPDILVVDENLRETCIRTLLATLERESGRWDQLELNHFPAASPALDYLRRVWPRADVVNDENRVGLVDLNEGFQAYHASLSRKMLKALRRCQRQLEGVGNVRFHSSNGVSSERWKLIREMHVDRQQRLNNKGGQGHYSVFGNEIEATAMEHAFSWAEQTGCARHYWLDIDDRPAAFALGLFQRDTYFYYFIGMDQRAEPFSGGVQLLLFLIEEEARRGVTTIDMMFGMSFNKGRFANAQKVLCNYRIKNRRLLSVARNGWVDLAKGLKKSASQPRRAGGET